MNTCSECGLTIEGGVFIGTINQGVAHQRCYHIANPPINRDTFVSVLCNSDDQLLVRALLGRMVPKYIQDEIIELFNAEMQDRHQKRIS